MMFVGLIIFIITGGYYIIKLFNDNLAPTDGATAMMGDKGLLVLFAIIAFIMTLISTVLGTSCIKSDFESTSINQILSFSIRRVEYVVSRIFGSWLISLCCFILSISLTAALLSSSSSTNLITVNLIFAVATTSLNMLSIITIACLFSLFVPRLFAFILTFILRYMISCSNSVFELLGTSSNGESVGGGEIFTGFFHFLFPRLGSMDALTSTFLSGRSVDFGSLVFLGHYLVTYLLLFSVLCWLINRRDV